MLTKRTSVLTTIVVIELVVTVGTFQLLTNFGPAAAALWLSLMFIWARVMRRNRIRKQGEVVNDN